MSNELRLLLRLLLQHHNSSPTIPTSANPANIPPMTGVMLVLELDDKPVAVDFCSADDPGDDPEGLGVAVVPDGTTFEPNDSSFLEIGEGVVEG